jgi:hypothetical protein
MCNNPPICHNTAGAGCLYGVCSYSQDLPGGPCPGGVCQFGSCIACSTLCNQPPPCHLIPTTCPGFGCSYPKAPAGTACAGGTCDGNGNCGP